MFALGGEEGWWKVGGLRNKRKVKSKVEHWLWLCCRFCRLKKPNSSIPFCNHRTCIICFSIRLSWHIHVFKKHWIPRMPVSTTAEVGHPGQGMTTRCERDEHPGWRCLAAPPHTSGRCYKDTSSPPNAKAGNAHKMTLGVQEWKNSPLLTLRLVAFESARGLLAITCHF